MKLLFVTNLYPPASIGGYEEICRDVADGLRAIGHEVMVLTSDVRSRRIGVDDGVVRYLRVDEKFQKRPNIVMDLHNVPTVKAALGRFRPDLVVVWNGAGLGYGFISLLESSVPTVYYLEDGWLEPLLAPGLRHASSGASLGPKRQLYRVGLRLVYRRTIHAGRIVFVSRHLKQWHQRCGADVAAASVIYNGISGLRFPARRARITVRASSEAPRLLYAGRIVPEKGIVTLIRALARLRSRGGLEGTELTLLGHLQRQEFGVTLARLIDTLDLTDAVSFVAHQPRSRLSEIYASHDVFVFPSEWEEPFGLTLLEAMATGMPVVSSLSGAPAEFVRHKVNGLAFRAGDADDLSDKLADVLRHPEESAVMAAVASADVHDRFSLAKQVRDLESVLRRQLSEVQHCTVQDYHQQLVP